MENFTITTLISIIILLLFGIFCLTIYHKKPSLEEIKECNEKFLIYLDKFFIKNVWFTSFKVLLYFILNFSIIIFLRNLLADDKFVIAKTDFILITKIILLFIIILLFKLFLDKLFFNDLIKLHIYLKSTNFYLELSSMIIPSYLIDFWGKCCLFFYNICKGQTLRDLNDPEYTEIDHYEVIYEKEIIVKISDKCIYFMEKNLIILLFMKVLRNIFGWLYENIRLGGFIPYIPKIIFISLILHGFTHVKIYYTIHIFYIYYIVTSIMDYLLFLYTKSTLTDFELANYFYKSKFNYVMERNHIKSNLYDFTRKLMLFDEGQTILRDIKNLSLVNYILNSFRRVLSDTTIKINKDFKSKYKRYSFLILFIFAIVYFYKNTFYIVIVRNNIQFSIIYLFILIYIILIILSTNTHIRVKPENEYETLSFENYKNRKKYNILFWLSAFICISMICILIIKTKLAITETILDTSYIKIIRYYTIEEKIALFYNKFDLYIKHYEIKDPHLYYLRLLIKELQIESFIFENTTLNEIDILINNYLSYYMDEIKLFMAGHNYPWMDNVKNIIISFALSLFLAKYINHFIINNDHKYLLDKTQFLSDFILKLIYYIFYKK